MKTTAGLLILTALLVPACSSAPAETAGTLASCTLPLSAFCDASAAYECDGALSYDQQLSRRATCCDGAVTEPGRCGEVITSTCGAYRVIAIGTLGIGTYLKQYYDATGALVGARHFTDTPDYCHGTQSSQEYGLVPACDEAPTVVCQRSGYLRPTAGVE